MISNAPDTMQKGVTGITQEQMQRVEDFLQGAAYAFMAQNGKNVDFEARTLVGGFNAQSWTGTPLQDLVEAYAGNYDEAGKACGRILFNVLQEDERSFESIAGSVKSYRWVD
ncbi:MAG: hypothetical protein FWH26_02625 [Oscillospiraceae bacterium]|nr:hypothetical protein [Oscillospiraceae bacterium]